MCQNPPDHFRMSSDITQRKDWPVMTLFRSWQHHFFGKADTSRSVFANTGQEIFLLYNAALKKKLKVFNANQGFFSYYFIPGPKIKEEGSMCCQGSAFKSTAVIWTFFVFMVFLFLLFLLSLLKMLMDIVGCFWMDLLFIYLSVPYICKETLI